jgi:hypothetical protein
MIQDFRFGMRMLLKQPGFSRIAVLTLALVDGRDFSSSDTRNAPSVAVINQALADRYFPKVNPVGKTLWLGKRQPSSAWSPMAAPTT